MARIMVARDLSTTQLVALRADVAKRLVDFAVKETGKDKSEFVVRDAMAGIDFTFNSEKWCNQIAQVLSTWTKDWSQLLPKTRFIAFYGAGNHSDDPTIIGAKLKVGANGQTVRDVIMFGKMHLEEVVKCYFDPVLYKGSETIYVELYTIASAGVTQYAEELEWFALVAEPYGEVISKPLP